MHRIRILYIFYQKALLTHTYGLIFPLPYLFFVYAIRLILRIKISLHIASPISAELSKEYYLSIKCYILNLLNMFLSVQIFIFNTISNEILSPQMM